MFPEQIVGDGFVLRALLPSDAAAMFDYLRRPEVFEATSSGGWTREAVDEFVRSNAEGMIGSRWCRYAIVPGGAAALAGDIGFGSIDIRNRRAEIGYHLAPESWGRGLMTRAVGALNAWAFAEGFHRIEATVMEGNFRSERVLQRSGFAREATLRDYKYVRGAFRDFSLWSLLATGGR
ncbi:MAG: GNAT family N-acetyltransferase [Dehalococcoidia bacterium]|nr:GNAT family N-acetyltransferase [Dehalococcoidia bacterium]